MVILDFTLNKKILRVFNPFSFFKPFKKKFIKVTFGNSPLKKCYDPKNENSPLKKCHKPKRESATAQKHFDGYFQKSESFNYFFFLLLFAMSERIKKFKELNKIGGRVLLEETREKIKRAKEDPRVIALVFFELIIILIIAVALFVYIDPEINLIQLNIPFPLNWIVKILAFAFIVVYFQPNKGLQKLEKAKI